MTEPVTQSISPTAVRCNDLTVVSGFERILRECHLDSLDALFAVANDQQLSKPGLETWRERIRLTLDVDGESKVFYLKRFSTPPRRDLRRLRRSLSGSPSHAGAEWTWMNRLAADGIACVTPVAIGEEVDHGREVRSALLTENVAGESLERWVERPEAVNQVRSLIAPLADLIARLHDRGYVHRDLYLSHIFYDSTHPPDRSLTLIDLQRIQRPAARRHARIVKDLAALNFSTPWSVASQTDRLRWFTRYLRIRKLDNPARQLLYWVVGKTRRIGRHHDRRTNRLRGNPA